MSESVCAVTTDWLDTTVTTGSMTVGSTLACYPDIWWERRQPYPWIQPVIQTVTTTARPIRLTLREVDVLREAARRDSGLKAVLQKFTPQIEVEMSLDS